MWVEVADGRMGLPVQLPDGDINVVEPAEVVALTDDWAVSAGAPRWRTRRATRSPSSSTPGPIRPPCRPSSTRCATWPPRTATGW